MQKDPLDAVLPWSLGIRNAFILLIVIGLKQVNNEVTSPYMDEIFHVRQAQRYCEGDFDNWDPKITTPPGLYLVTLFVQRASKVVGLDFDCNLNFLRSINTVLAIFLFQTFRSLLYQIRRKSNWMISGKEKDLTVSEAIDDLWQALDLVLFPVLFSFIFLYYTDVGSTLLVLWTYLLSLRGRHWAAAIVGVGSLFFRQTNIVWVMYSGAIGLVCEMVRSGEMDVAVSLKQFFQAPLNHVQNWLIALDKCRWTLLTTMMPYAVVLGSFLRFLIWNGGITLGDKANHQAGFNVPQMWHFIAFASFFSSPLLLNGTVLKSVKGILKASLPFLIVMALVMFTSIKLLTYTHPFLLADNRHYSSVVWRYLMRLSPWPRYVAIVPYLLSMLFVYHQLQNSSAIICLGLLAATAMVLIPSPLLEFRYFIISYLLYRLHTPPSSSQGIKMEGIFYAIINLIIGYRFLCQPFTWENKPDELQRFMW